MRSWVLLLSFLFLVGCASDGDKDSGSAAQATQKKKTKKSRLTRFTFKGAESNAKTGGTLATKQDDTTLVGARGEEVTLTSFQGKPLVLVFMRGFAGFVCPFCTTYTAQIATRYEEIKAAGGEVVVVYPTRKGDESKIAEFVAACNEILEEEGEEAVPFTVLLDPETRVVQKYNLQGDLSKPSTFVLDAKGQVRYAYVGKKTSDRPSVDRIVREVQELGAGD